MAMNKRTIVIGLCVLAILVAAVLLISQYTKPAGPAANLTLVDNEKMVFTAIYPEADKNRLAAIDLVQKWPRQRAIIVVEPSGVNLTEFARGTNDLALDGMLGYVSEQGLGDVDTVWVPFSEYNNYPGSPNPEEFTAAVNHFAAAAKAKFPQSRIGVLLDCRSNLAYSGRPGSWGIQPLDPYLVGLDKNNVTVLFFQGFPRVAPDEDMTRAASFLNANTAMEAANALGIKEITFVTGTAAVYGPDGKYKIVHTPERRQSIISDELTQIDSAKKAGYVTKLLIFAENKSATQADWSYTRGKGDALALRNLVGAATSAGIEVSLFDPQGNIKLSSLA